MKREDLLSIFKLHQADLGDRGVGNIAIFGSAARDDMDDFSDVDVLVEFNRPVGLFEFIRLKLQLEKWIGLQVDLVTPDAIHPALRERILNEAVFIREIS